MLKIDIKREILEDALNSKIVQYKRKSVAEVNPMIRQIIGEDISALTKALNSIEVVTEPITSRKSA